MTKGREALAYFDKMGLVDDWLRVLMVVDDKQADDLSDTLLQQLELKPPIISGGVLLDPSAIAERILYVPCLGARSEPGCGLIAILPPDHRHRRGGSSPYCSDHICINNSFRYPGIRVK